MEEIASVSFVHTIPGLDVADDKARMPSERLNGQTTSHHVLTALAVIMHISPVRSCTILQFTNHSFSANAVRLFHALPIFEGTNGTLYLDFTASTHKCHADGGWQDFFDLGSHAGDEAFSATANFNLSSELPTV